MDNPCSNCITKPICKLQIEEVYNDVHIGSSYSKHVALYSAYMNRLSNMCPMIKEYIKMRLRSLNITSAQYRHQYVAEFLDRTFFEGKYEINAFLFLKSM